jgi:hypothetical protein
MHAFDRGTLARQSRHGTASHGDFLWPICNNFHDLHGIFSLGLTNPEPPAD